MDVRKYLDTLQSDSDSGDSLFITQHNVCKAELTRKPRRSPRLSSKLQDGNESDTRSSIASPGQCLPGRKRAKLPKYSFPFLQGKPTSNGFTVQKNTKLHYAVMGGFLIGVRELQASFNRGEDLQASLPTIDEDGLCLSPISEVEGDTMEEEAIRVVKKNCFVVSSKRRGREKHQRSDKDQLQLQRRKDRSKTNQTEPSMENILDQNQTDTLCCNDDATESNPRENNGSKSAAGADPELLSTGIAGGQILHNNGTNNDTACHESGIMEKRRKKRNRKEYTSREEEQGGEEASNLTIKDQMSFTKDEMHTAELKHEKKKRIKNCREAEEANENNHGKSDMRDEEDLDIYGKRKREITDSKETEQVQADTAFDPPSEDAQVSKKKKKRSKIMKLSLKQMDETSECLEDAASPQETSEKPESVSNDDPAGEVTEAVTNNMHTSSHISMKKKKKKKRKSSPQIVDVLLNQDEEEEEPPPKPAEGADSADLVTKKRKKKKKSSLSICSETLAGTEDSECVTTSSPPADAEEKAVSGPRDPTSAEISTSLEEDNVLRRKKKKKKKKIEAAERKDDEETHPSQSGDGIEVNGKKKGKRDTLTLTGAPHSAVDVDVQGKTKKRAHELSFLADNDSMRLTESTLACSSQTSLTEQTSDTPGNVNGKRKSNALKSDCVSSALTVTHSNRKNKQGKGKRRLHNPCEDFLSED